MGQIIEFQKKKKERPPKTVSINFTNVTYIEHISDKKCKVYFSNKNCLYIYNSAIEIKKKMMKFLKEVYSKK